MDEVIADFVEGWLRDNEAVVSEIVALQGDDPTTPYGAALAAAMARVTFAEDGVAVARPAGVGAP